VVSVVTLVPIRKAETMTASPGHVGMPLARRVAALTGADGWRTAPLPEIGLRSLALSDGPSGVRGGAFGTQAYGTLLPNATAIAATWDEALARRAGRLLGVEARRAGIDWLLAPVLNLHRTPFGGRHFECFSEDPLLTGDIGVAVIRGIQSAGVSATAKHFVANESETGRLEYDSVIDERTLREVYLPPFEAAVRRGGVDAVMAAYNRVNGRYATEDRRLLTEVLREEWGFRGAVVSDWGAARTTVPTAAAGIDLVMPGPDGPWGELLVDAVHAGEISEQAIDDKLASLVRVAGRAGSGACCSSDTESTGHGELLVTLAAESMVLLENDGALPLERPARVALIGPGAADLALQGGGSARVRPEPVPSLEEELASLLARGSELRVEPGVRIRRNLAPLHDARIPDGIGVSFESADGEVLERRILRHSDIVFDEAIPDQVASIRVSARVLLREPGRHQLGIRGNGDFAVRIDEEQPVGFTLAAPDRDPLSPIVEPLERRIEVEGGREVMLDIALRWDHTAEWHVVDLGHEPPTPGNEELFARAVEAASGADVAVVVVGTSAEYESEGFDRTTLALPGRQDELVRAVAAVCARTVVVVNAGSPVLLPWADHVSAVLWAWFPGQCGARALAECLVGLREPGGRLPTALPLTEVGAPSAGPVDAEIVYAERDRFGSRGHAPVHYPIGYGLGYTTWCTESAVAHRDGDGLEVVATVRNTGARTGKHVVRVLVDEADTPARLVGFAPVVVGPGDTADVSVTVRPEALRRWHPGGWQYPAGPIRLLVNRAAPSDQALVVDVAASTSHSKHAVTAALLTDTI